MSAIDPTYPAYTYGSGDISDTALAGEAISAKRAIKVFNGSAYLADASISGDEDLVVGITLGAANAGSNVTYQFGSTIQDNSWTWVEGPVYLGTNGQLTQSLSGLAFMQQIGVALSATELLIDIEQAIILN